MKIVLAIDDSAFSRQALRAVARQFQRKGTEVRVVHVVEPVSGYMSADLFPHLVTQVAEVEADRRKQGGELVHRAARELRKAGFKASEVVDGGLAKERIIECAKDWGADLIVLGSHGLTGVNRFLMGSVSEAVSRHAGCSVEVVRSGGTPKPRAKARSKR